MQVRSVTNIFPINKKISSLVPNAPMFFFKNIGNTNMYVDGFLLRPGERFGVDHSQFLATFWAAGKKLSIKEKTTYKVWFGDTVVEELGTEAPYPPGPETPNPAGIMVTTEYILE